MEAQLRDLAGVVQGTPEDWRAAEKLTYAAFHAPIASCMSDHGIDYRYPPLIDYMAGRDRALIPDTFTALAELPDARGLQPNVARDVAATYRVAQAYSGPVDTGDPGRGYMAALDACGGTSIENSPEWPVPDADLETAFLGLMRAAQESPAVTAATDSYLSCMQQKGYPVQEETDLYQRVTADFGDFRVNVEDPRATKPPSGPAWDTAVAQEIAAGGADRTCRTPAHVAAMLALDGKVAAFRTQHASELAAANDFWAALRARAAAVNLPALATD